MVDGDGKRFLPITDYVHNVLRKRLDEPNERADELNEIADEPNERADEPNERADESNDNTLTLEPMRNHAETSFEEIFTGFYHNNEKCEDYSKLIIKAYRSPLLEQIDWGSEDTLAKAFEINRTDTHHRISILDGTKHFDLLKMRVTTDGEEISVPNLEFTIDDSGKRIISLPEDDDRKAIPENLSKCNFASLAYEVTFQDTEIKNPKIAIYPYDEGIQVKLVENLDEEFIYSKDLAVTFTLIDTEQEANEESELNKFEVIGNAERRYISFGYKKVTDFDGESDFKLYFPDKKKYIVVNVWSRLDLQAIEKNRKKALLQCKFKKFKRSNSYRGKSQIDSLLNLDEQEKSLRRSNSRRDESYMNISRRPRKKDFQSASIPKNNEGSEENKSTAWPTNNRPNEATPFVPKVSKFQPKIEEEEANPAKE